MLKWNEFDVLYMQELALMSSPRSSLSGLAGATSAPSPLPALTSSSLVPAARPTKSHIVISQKRDDVTNVVDSNPGAQVCFVFVVQFHSWGTMTDLGMALVIEQ